MNYDEPMTADHADCQNSFRATIVGRVHMVQANPPHPNPSKHTHMSIMSIVIQMNSLEIICKAKGMMILNIAGNPKLRDRLSKLSLY